MKYIFKKVTVVDHASPYHQQQVNILINNDQIEAIGAEVEDDKAKTIALENALVSIGWTELHSDFSEPGNEDREDILTGCAAAAAGGFTNVALVPSTSPVIQAKSDVEYLIKKGDETAVNILPIGAVSKNLAGEEITEMFDMQQAGAVAFYDDKNAIKNPNLLKTALLYAKGKAPVMVHPRHPDLTKGGQINEGVLSTNLGLKGIPAFAEELMIARDLFIAAYTETSIHFAGVSTKGSVQLIKEAKEKGLQVTADVNFYNLILNEEVLCDFDSNYKVNPPLRTQEDVDALITGLQDNTIDAIAIDHMPQDIERKRCEFDRASYGMAGIETAFSSMNTIVSALKPEGFVEKMANGPRQILDLPQLRIVEGSIAELTFFNLNTEWTLNKGHKKSKAANNPFVSKPLKGKVLGTFNKGKFHSAD